MWKTCKSRCERGSNCQSERKAESGLEKLFQLVAGVCPQALAVHTDIRT